MVEFVDWYQGLRRLSSPDAVSSGDSCNLHERAFSNDYSDAFRLYRVYEFTTAPKLFILPGAIEQHVHLLPQNYKARF